MSIKWWPSAHPYSTISFILVSCVGYIRPHAPSLSAIVFGTFTLEANRIQQFLGGWLINYVHVICLAIYQPRSQMRHTTATVHFDYIIRLWWHLPLADLSLSYLFGCLVCMCYIAAPEPKVSSHTIYRPETAFAAGKCLCCCGWENALTYSCRTVLKRCDDVMREERGRETWRA